MAGTVKLPVKLLTATKRIGPFVVLSAMTAYLYRNLLIDSIPATGDHLCHLFLGWLQAEELLPSFRITGFSHMAYAGFPAGMYYPVGGSLYLALVRYLSFGQISWETVYRIALFGVVLIGPISVYLIARRAASRTASLIGGVLAMGDLGGWRQGGSIFTIYWGVWPYMLSCSLTLIGLSLLEKPLTDRFSNTRRTSAAAVLLLAFSVLTHPIAAVFLLAAAPLFAFLAVGYKRQIATPKAILFRAALVGCAAVGICLFWLVPQLATVNEITESFGDPWVSLKRLPIAFISNTLFAKFSVFAYGLGLVGIFFGFVSRKLWPVYFGLTILLTLVLSAALGEHFSQKVQFERLSAFVKGFFFAAAAVGVDSTGRLIKRITFRFVRTVTAERADQIANRVGPVLGGIALLVIIAGDWTGHFTQVGKFRPLKSDLWADIKNADHWLSTQKQLPFSRVLYQPGKVCDKDDAKSRECRRVYDNHVFAAGPVFSGLSKIKFGFEPTATYRYLPLINHWPRDIRLIQKFLTDKQALARLGITWVVSLSPFSKRDDLVQVKRFGEVRIYKVKTDTWRPSALLGNPFLTVETFEDERVSVLVKKGAPNKTVVFPIAYHPYWQASINGTPLKIVRADIVQGVRKILIAVKTPTDGRIVLEFVRPPLVRAASVISLILFIGCLILLVAPRLPNRIE
jgi:hypothetical protein